MPVYRSVGKTLVAQEEIAEKSDAFSRLFEGKEAKMLLRSGSVDAATVEGATFSAAGRDARPFDPIGLGKPLTIWITSAYPGDLPPKGGRLFGKVRGALVSSAVKSWQTFDMQPRAFNILKQTATRRVPIAGPAATEEGTPVVFYSPSLIDRSLILTVEMAFDNVDEDVFKAVGSVFGSAAGLPVFASAAPYLLAASVLFRLGGEIGNRVFDSRAEFQATENINLDLPGMAPAQAGFALLTRSEVDEKTLRDYFITSTGELVHKTTNAAYAGELPYVIVALDGKSDTSLQNFKATAASAALLQKFYNIRQDGQTDAKILSDALKFYNDFRFREEARDLAKRIEEADSEDEKKRLQERYKAVLKNIQSDEFKIKAGG